MQLEGRPDFPEVKERWDKFWNGEQLDRPLFQIEVPKTGCIPAGKPYPVRPDRPVEPVVKRVLDWVNTHEFYGEAVPFFMMEFAPVHFSTFLGCELQYLDNQGTSWAVPFVKDWGDTDLYFHKDSFYWEKTVEFISILRAHCDGKVIINAPGLAGGLDALAAIRGTEKLMLDLYECPEKVHRALDKVCSVYGEVVEELAKVAGWDAIGSVNWNGMYSSGRMNTLQCDVSALISPAMFKEFVAPRLQKDASCYDNATYHLDGPGELPHLETICGLDGIDVIQWVPLPQESSHNWFELYRQIDNLGKGMIIPCSDLSAIKKMWEEFSTRRLIFQANVGSRREAELLLNAFA